jgi:hypothetical protein
MEKEGKEIKKMGKKAKTLKFFFQLEQQFMIKKQIKSSLT